MAIKKIMTPAFRVSFPSVFEASSYEGGVAKFSVSAVFQPSLFNAKDKELWKAMEALADEVSVEKFKRKLAQLPANFKKPFRDGEEKLDLEGYGAGKIFCNLSSKMKPGIVGIDRTPILDASDFYPGCWARATITCYAYDNVGKGVAFGLQNLQKLKDDTRLDSRTDASEDFDSDVDERYLDGGEDDPLG